MSYVKFVIPEAAEPVIGPTNGMAFWETTHSFYHGEQSYCVKLFVSSSGDVHTEAEFMGLPVQPVIVTVKPGIWKKFSEKLRYNLLMSSAGQVFGTGGAIVLDDPDPYAREILYAVMEAKGGVEFEAKNPDAQEPLSTFEFYDIPKITPAEYEKMILGAAQQCTKLFFDEKPSVADKKAPFAVDKKAVTEMNEKIEKKKEQASKMPSSSSFSFGSDYHVSTPLYFEKYPSFPLSLSPDDFDPLKAAATLAEKYKDLVPGPKYSVKVDTNESDGKLPGETPETLARGDIRSDRFIWNKNELLPSDPTHPDPGLELPQDVMELIHTREIDSGRTGLFPEGGDQDQPDTELSTPESAS